MAKLLANIYIDYLSEEKHYIEHFKKFDAKISEMDLQCLWTVIF